MPSGRGSTSCTLPAPRVWCCQHVTAPHPHLCHANPNQALPLGFAVGCWGAWLPCDLPRRCPAAGRGLIGEDEGRCCTACEVIVRRSKPCGGSVAESAEKGEGEVARVRLAVNCGSEFRHVHGLNPLVPSVSIIFGPNLTHPAPHLLYSPPQPSLLINQFEPF